jgi:hypothetical protein
MRFDWASFFLGLCAGILILGAWQMRVDRLRRKTMRIALEAGISLAQYAKDIEAAESGKWR